MLIRYILTAVCLGSILLFAPSAGAQWQRAPLKGLKAIAVDARYYFDGNTYHNASLLTRIEYRLRMAGIKVIDKGMHEKIPGRPVLDFYFVPHHDTRLVLIQDVLLVRDPKISFRTETWSSSITNSSDELLDKDFEHCITEFINDFLAANDGRKEHQPN